MSFFSKFIVFVSGEVPGGIMALIVPVFLYDLTMYLLGKHSGLFPWEKAKARMKSFTLFVTALYLVVWFALRPPALPPRIIVFPTSSKSVGERLLLPLLLENHLKKDIQGEYIFHPAEWIVTSGDPDSLLNWDYHRKVAARMEAEYALLSSFDGGQWKWEIIAPDEEKALASGEFPNVKETYEAVANSLQEVLGLNFKEKNLLEENIPSPEVMRLFWWGNTDSTEKVLTYYNEADTSVQKNEIAMAVYAHAVIWKAYQMKKEAEKVKNPYKRSREYQKWFRKGRNELIRIGRRDPDNLLVNLTMADAYILEENFDYAEIALKNAFATDPYNAEVYFLFSFLDPSRYRDLHFENVREILEKAIYLDPMYEAAVVRYIRQIGEENISKERFYFDKAAEYAKHFLRIKPSSYLVWNELAGMYSTGKEYKNALAAIEKALSIRPDDEYVLFNAGIIYYRLDKFEQALKYFNKSIELYNTLDAYLYRGTIYMKQKKYKEAVINFRYRIVHKRSDDDFYYIQAAKGLNKVINELDKQGINIDDLVPPQKVN